MKNITEDVNNGQLKNKETEVKKKHLRKMKERKLGKIRDSDCFKKKFKVTPAKFGKLLIFSSFI